MASEVDIANIALSRLGNRATVSSLDPPEGSPEAAHCASFYPIARDSLLEMHFWSFATRRVALALLSEAPPSEWQYAYAAPDDILKINAVTAIDASDDYSTGLQPPYSVYGASNTETSFGVYTPQPYVRESLEDGSPVIYTNQETAAIRYTRRITDSTRFTPLFCDALGVLLASYLAGPILKGDAGRRIAQALRQEAEMMLSRAAVSDANQRRASVAHAVPWQVNR
jgi:hypothetical protein